MLNFSLFTIDYKSDFKFNGDLHTRHYVQQQQAQQQQQAESSYNALEHSWIYILCMRCRMEDNSPSWEPSFWQKCCPYPLCPSFRQFARLISIILIGELNVIVENWNSTKLSIKDLRLALPPPTPYPLSLSFYLTLYISIYNYSRIQTNQTSHHIIYQKGPDLSVKVYTLLSPITYQSLFQLE